MKASAQAFSPHVHSERNWNLGTNTIFSNPSFVYSYRVPESFMSTQRVSVREARRRLPRLLDQVQAGDEVVVLRRGVEVGRLVGPERKRMPLPDLSGLRASVKLQGRALNQDIKKARRSSRY